MESIQLGEFNGQKYIFHLTNKSNATEAEAEQPEYGGGHRRVRLRARDRGPPRPTTVSESANDEALDPAIGHEAHTSVSLVTEKD